ncbi:hypothetical protein [Treponema phagedenis]|uniref:hypothetical protein n=1 Tax=Treponema phagedenis TaxID=162 RepID=UPI0015A7249C|nr:hypothetical protein [Treponema phagedenis]NVP24397.1 hypothetical protein [Treponema phagedenis]
MDYFPEHCYQRKNGNDDKRKFRIFLFKKIDKNCRRYRCGDRCDTAGSALQSPKEYRKRPPLMLIANPGIMPNKHGSDKCDTCSDIYQRPVCFETEFRNQHICNTENYYYTDTGQPIQVLIDRKS